MQLFVKTKTVKFDDAEVTVKEIGVNYMLLSDAEKRDTKKVLGLHTSLTTEQVDNLSTDAFNELIDAFYKLNEEHFIQEDSKGEDEGK